MKAMKKHFFFMLPVVTLLAAALLSSCSSSDDDVTGGTDPVKPEPKVVYFTAQLGGKGSNGGSSSAKALSPRRVVTDPDDGTLKAEWEENEKVALIYNGVLAEATVTSVSSGVATISAQLTEGNPTNGMDVKLVYPAAAADATTTSGIKADYLKSGQDGILATLSAKYDVAVADGKFKVDGQNGSLQKMVSLINQYAICKFSFRQSGTAITGITTLKVGDMLVRGTNLSSVYVAFDPTVSGVMRFTVINGTSTYTGTASPSLQAGMFYRPTISLNASEYALVDPDLPSGTLWATTNVGATSPEGYGDYFAWGETEPYYTDGNAQNSATTGIWKTDKTGYNWESYTKFGTYKNASPDYGLTKYNKTNGPTTLDATDDAAAANWGSAWKMPTQAQWQELVEKYPFGTSTPSGKLGYCQWTDNYNNTGVKGLAFYKGSDTSTIVLFLPAAGVRIEAALHDQGSRGDYWSSELYHLYSDHALRLAFYSYNPFVDLDEGYRCRGYSVRPVLAQ